MNYSALDRFKGAWLGSIIGAALSENTNKLDYNKIVQYKFADWIKSRDTIAQVIINQQPIKSATPQLNKIFAEYCSIVFSNDVDGGSEILKVALINRNGNAISMLLPLIIIQEDCQEIENLYTNIILQYSLDSVDTTEIRQEIVIWNYLITLVLNNKLQLEKSNVSMIVKQVLGGVEVETASLVQKLETVSQAWKRGLSLSWLADRLYQQDLEKETIPTVGSAIALSLYCFISTPRNFMLSVKRAAVMGSELSAIVTVLTASISGAYNGMSGIPRNWLLATRNHQSYQQAQKTVARLAETWIGVHNPDNLTSLYDPEVNAVDAPRIFQSRQSLKIISQKSSLS